jgi:DnaJ family protein C protein 11
MGEAKSLRVQYLFRDKLHEVTVDDMEGLRAPLRTHILDDSRNATGGHNWDA